MVLLFGFSFDTEAKAEQKEEWQNELSLEQADLSLQENTEQSFSLQQYVTDVMDGTADFSFGAIVDCICEQVTGQWDAQKKTILHILALSVFAGIFAKFGFNWQYIKDVNSYFVCSNDWLSGNPGLVSSGNGPCEK